MYYNPVQNAPTSRFAILLCLYIQIFLKIREYDFCEQQLHTYVKTFQIKEVPNDFFVDIVSSSNFLATILNQMFCFIRQNKDRIEPQLTSRVEKFAAHLSQKFSWIFDDEEDEDDKPVIVTSEVENSNTQSENP